MTRYLRLKENHPVQKKYEELCAFADKLGISVSLGRFCSRVTHGDRDYELRYIDDDEPVRELPPSTETKLVYVDPAWEAEQLAERKAYQEAQAKKKAEEAEQKKRDVEARARAEAERREREERALLAKLKAKYEGS